MSGPKQVVQTPLGFQTPLWNPAIIHNGTVYVSGNIGMDYSTNTATPGSVSDRTRQAITNMKNVLEAAGSDLSKLVKVNIYLTSMTNYAAMNKVWAEMVPDPKPARTCVAVAELPFGTDVEIECTAHL